MDARAFLMIFLHDLKSNLRKNYVFASFKFIIKCKNILAINVSLNKY